MRNWNSSSNSNRSKDQLFHVSSNTWILKMIHQMNNKQAEQNRKWRKIDNTCLRQIINVQLLNCHWLPNLINKHTNKWKNSNGWEIEAEKKENWSLIKYNHSSIASFSDNYITFHRSIYCTCILDVGKCLQRKSI